jgi:hypothetical protein
LFNYVTVSGDNFYNDGVVSVDDPLWNDSWRNVYDGDNIGDLTWYVSVGNHDHTLVTNNELNQVRDNLKVSFVKGEIFEGDLFKS